VTARRSFCLLATGLLGSFSAPAQQPLTLVQAIEMPEVPAGPYADHMALDLEGRRLETLIGTRCTSSTRFGAVTTISCNCSEFAPASAPSAPIGHKRAATAGALEIDFVVRMSLPPASKSTEEGY